MNHDEQAIEKEIQEALDFHAHQKQSSDYYKSFNR